MPLGVQTTMLDSATFEAPSPMLAELVVVDAPVRLGCEEYQSFAAVQAKVFHMLFV